MGGALLRGLVLAAALPEAGAQPDKHTAFRGHKQQECAFWQQIFHIEAAEPLQNHAEKSGHRAGQQGGRKAMGWQRVLPQTLRTAAEQAPRLSLHLAGVLSLHQPMSGPSKAVRHDSR